MIDKLPSDIILYILDYSQKYKYDNCYLVSKYLYKVATKKYVMWIPGDNSHQGKEITKIIEKLNNYDIVTTYYINTTKRNFLRRTFTKLYNPFLNFIFGFCFLKVFHFFEFLLLVFPKIIL